MIKIIFIKDSKYIKKGEIIRTTDIVGGSLIRFGIAKEYKPENNNKND